MSDVSPAVLLIRAVLADPDAVDLLRTVLLGDGERGARPLAYSVRTLAEATHMTEKSVRGAIQRGELRATRRGEQGPYVIAAQDADAWLRRSASSGASSPSFSTVPRERRPPRPGPLSAALADLVGTEEPE